mgnify:CR=1 FL=1
MNTNKARIIIIEDNENYRKVISRTLKNEPDFELIKQYGTAEIALREIEHSPSEHNPDVILLDLNLPGMHGLQALAWLKEYCPKTHVIILTQSEQEACILQAIQSGAIGYLLKSATASQIKESIRTVIAGGASLDPEVTSLIFNRIKKKPRDTRTKITLSEREQDILNLISKGIEKKQIGDTLHISSNTVAYHVKNIYDKLNVSNAPAAVRQAFRSGILDPKK